MTIEKKKTGGEPCGDRSSLVGSPSRARTQERDPKPSPVDLLSWKRQEFKDTKVAIICRTKYQQGGTHTERDLEIYKESP